MTVKAQNEQLARDYFRCVSQCAASLDTYLSIRMRIMESLFDFRAHYEQHGSLRDCKIPGVGLKTIEILERLLSEGVTRVAATTAKEREESIRPMSGGASRDNILADQDASSSGALDNAIRAIEGDSP